MSFNYDQLKSKSEEHGSWWTAYADLFMVLSVVFLLLYVTASLRTGSSGIQAKQEMMQVSKRNAELEEQMRVYDTLKEEQLQAQSENEQKTYTELMSKLSLLQDEATQEKQDLMKKAHENERKAVALNQYQQIIRNIIDANVLAKSQIKTRNIKLNKQGKELQSLNVEIQQKEAAIQENQQRIEGINRQLEKSIQDVKNGRLAAHLTKKQMTERIAKLRQHSENKIQELEGKNNAVAEELQSMRGTLSTVKSELGNTRDTLNKTQVEKEQLAGALVNERAEADRKIAGLRAAHEARMASERAAFEQNLRASNLNAQAKAKKLAEFQGQADQQARELQGKIAALSGKVKETESQLAGAERDKSRYVASIEGLKGDLARTQELAQARQKLAQRIRENLNKAGLNAKVDPKTGEVTIAFGEDYFEAGSAQLTSTMKKALNSLIPVYSASLLGDAKTAEKVANVEIIGFASPTYKGRYVNPTSLAPADQEAVNYNLKLSFSRANAIFRHAFNPQKLSFKHQKDLLPLVKVVGRGFLPEGVKAEEIPGGLEENTFCKRYNCQRAQRVILKFNLKD